MRKHADASAVEVSMRRNGVYEFCVSDDGDGFDAAMIEQPPGGHMGLRIMRERAQRIGGSVTIDTARAAGTRVTLVLPLAQPEAAKAAA